MDDAKNTAEKRMRRRKKAGLVGRNMAASYPGLAWGYQRVQCLGGPETN